MSARPLRSLSPRAGLALGIALCALGCEDDDVMVYQGSLPGELTAAPEATAEPIAYECVPTPSACPGDPAALPSYAGQIVGIIERHCGNCHLENNLGGPWPFSSWQDVNDWVSSIRISLEQCLMPPPDSDAPISPADREIFQTWLACGAPNN